MDRGSAARPSPARSGRVVGEFGPAELRLIQVVVGALGGHQGVVVALFDDAALAHHQDGVGVADRGEPVRDHERRPPLPQGVHGPLQ